ncbi:MAG TPA: PEP-CTERM sorting domain-containing protein [Stellaceae bacterium]|nr:PEP-CTERM sorting domain-containing protein [Stellaceae bacterium]
MLKEIFARLTSKHTLAAIALAALSAGAVANPAYAIVLPWSGAGSGGTPNLDGQPTFSLGDTWVLANSNTTWQITLNNGTQPSIFNQTGFNNSNGTFATGFQFTINSGVAGINTAGTELIDVTTGKTWLANFSLGGPSQRVTFTAPAGTQLSMSDNYLLDIDFAGAANPAQFSFAALWSDTSIPVTGVPEPASLPILGAAVLGLFMLRRHLQIAA